MTLCLRLLNDALSLSTCLNTHVPLLWSFPLKTLLEWLIWYLQTLEWLAKGEGPFGSHEGIHHISDRCKIMAAEMETRLRDSVQNLSRCEAWQHLACHSRVANSDWWFGSLCKFRFSECCGQLWHKFSELDLKQQALHDTMTNMTKLSTINKLFIQHCDRTSSQRYTIREIRLHNPQAVVVLGCYRSHSAVPQSCRVF